MSKLYVLAGNAAQAAEFAREHNIPLPSIAYVADAHRIRGVSNPAFVVVGSFWLRQDADEVWRNVQTAIAGSRDLEMTFPTRMIQPPPAQSNPTKRHPKKKVVIEELDEDDLQEFEDQMNDDGHFVPQKKTFRKMKA